MCVRVRGVGTLTVEQMIQNNTYTLLLMSLPSSTPVHQATSVVDSKNCALVNVGDSVEFSAGPHEVMR